MRVKEKSATKINQKILCLLLESPRCAVVPPPVSGCSVPPPPREAGPDPAQSPGTDHTSVTYLQSHQTNYQAL